MKFLSIELENIFAYDQRHEVPLDATSPDRNLVLIWGRNGYGKTSFINAVKLLFTGAMDGRFRLVGFPAKQLTFHDYVLGQTNHWLGVINRAARQRELDDVTARVSARIEHEGRIIQVERRWSVEGGTPQEALEVIDGDRLLKDAAEERLQTLLPKEFAHFFFFDGEDIKAMAESIETKQVDFDRLLRLTYLSDAATELERVAADRAKQGLGGPILELLGAAESALAKANRSKQQTELDLDNRQNMLVDENDRLRRLQTRRENLSSGASAAHREELETRRKFLSNRLSDIHAEIAEHVPANAPVLANLDLAGIALTLIDKRLAGVTSAEAVLTRRIKTALPSWLAEDIVALDAVHRERIVDHLARRLDSLDQGPLDEGLFAGLEVWRAERLRGALNGWTVGGPDRRKLQAASLAEAYQLSLELDQVSDALLKIEVGSQVNLEEYRKVMQDISGLEPKIAELNQKLGSDQDRLKDLQAEIERLSKEKIRLESSQAVAEKNAKEAKFIRSVSKAVNDVREKLRKASRQRLETLINERFKNLVHDHDLVDRIELDDLYTLYFLDIQGERLGRASLSSGLKQLAATALLWAMKDAAADRSMPVIIDTPLGRIDRQNQERLLLHYYTEISDQVIILPTNSEIDRSKRALLESHIAAEYSIRNERGDRASIEPGAPLEVS